MYIYLVISCNFVIFYQHENREILMTDLLSNFWVLIIIKESNLYVLADDIYKSTVTLSL